MAETVVIAGTHRPNSNTLRVAQHLEQELRKQGVDATLLNLQELPSDFLQTDFFGKRSEAFTPIETLLTQAQRYVWVLPEYNGGFPGVVKALVDSMNPREVFRGKVAGLVGVSSGKFGNLRGLDMFSLVLNYIQVQVMPFRAHLMKISEAPDWPEGYSLDELNQFVTRFRDYAESQPLQSQQTG